MVDADLRARGRRRSSSATGSPRVRCDAAVRQLEPPGSASSGLMVQSLWPVPEDRPRRRPSTGSTRMSSPNSTRVSTGARSSGSPGDRDRVGVNRIDGDLISPAADPGGWRHDRHHHAPATYRNETPYPFCPGCGHGRSSTRSTRRCTRSALDPARVVVIVSDIGCTGLSDQYFATSAFHGLHGRSITYATGIKLAVPTSR